MNTNVCCESANCSKSTRLPGRNVAWDQEYLRNTAWEISERKPVEAFTPTTNHIAMAMVNPCRGFAHWRISPEWIEEARQKRGDRWRDCRIVLRLYDVSYITFNGLNANKIQDYSLPCICGQMFFNLSHAGTWQLGEVGFLLRDGEFIPAARSHTISFPRASTSSYGAQEALLVEEKSEKEIKLETVGNLWEQEKILKDRKTPKLRQQLHIAILSLTLDRSGPPEFIAKLAMGLAESGHEVDILSPTCDDDAACQNIPNVRFHGFDLDLNATPLEIANEFRMLVEWKLKTLPPFDIVHVHDWLAGVSLPAFDSAKICSLTSLETTRLNGTTPTDISKNIEDAEREVAQSADMVLVPGWLHDTAVKQLRIDGAHVRSFAMEGRQPNEWDCPLDFGQVKRDINFGPMDRMLLFIGPLEHAAGPDLLLEAMPILLGRAPNLRVAFAGSGDLFGHLQNRAKQLGVDYAVRLLGHVDRDHINRLLRASEALVLPSRFRVPFDDAVVDLAHLAGKPVVTTHGGPAHLVRHEETGIITYDNPGSMVWALDRILGDPSHSQRMGENGRREENRTASWNEVARRYLDICASSFPNLSTVPA
jgi:glycosyltransferase involved in cell wall biosynthesis